MQSRITMSALQSSGREAIKRWPMQWKVNLIVSINPEWWDLSLEL